MALSRLQIIAVFNAGLLADMGQERLDNFVRACNHPI